MSRAAPLLVVTLVTFAAGATWSSSAMAQPAPQMELCHFTASGAVLLLRVSANAAGGHMGHGDVPTGAFYSDLDGDGFGAGAAQPCPGHGLVDNDRDCNDNDATVTRSGVEVPYNGIDDDCDAGTPDDDLDGDGALVDSDCDDEDATRSPLALEQCDDGIDDDCDGLVDEACISACPCFTADDIIAAYAEYLDNAELYDTQTEICRDYDTFPQDPLTGYTEEMVFFSNVTDELNEENESVRLQQYFSFFSYGFDASTAEHFCGAQASELVYNFTESRYEHASSETTFLHIDITERRGCEQTAVDTALALGVDCTIF